MAVESKSNNISLNNQEGMLQVRQFLKGATRESKISSQDLVKSAVFLLKTLPSTRFAVLEYFTGVYDDTIYNLLATNEDSLDGSLYEVIDDIQESLLAFVQINPHAWTPIISSWSIELLGQISSKYTGRYLERKGIGLSASLNEVLQMWMGCRATKSLIEIASECIASMVGDTPDSCVDALLETSVKHSPHFDWVVAHIGSCFPNTIINRVLMCGLKDFCSHGGSQAEIGLVSQDKMPKFASVVGILGHLASQHGREIKTALLNLFEESLQDDTKEMYHQVVPFLLRLASLSPMLLKVITTDLIGILTTQILNKLAVQSVYWYEKGEADNDSLLHLLVHLVINSEYGTYRLLQLLLEMAFPQNLSDSMETDQQVIPKPEVQQVCKKVIELLMFDLSKVVHAKSAEASVDIPFLKGLQHHSSSISRMFCHAEGERHIWLCKIMKCLAVSSGESQASKLLCDVLVHSKTTEQLSFFVTLQEELQIKFPDILENTLQDLFHVVLSTSKEDKKTRTLKNMLTVLKWESRSDESATVTRHTFKLKLDTHLESITALINHPGQDVSYTALQVVNYTDLPKQLSVAVVTKLCHGVVAHLFRVLKSRDTEQKFIMCKNCKECLQKLCCYASAQKSILRLLLEMSLAKESSLLLGGKIIALSTDQTNVEIEKHKPVLLQANSFKGRGSGPHGGVIGQGLRLPPTSSLLTKEQTHFNKQQLLDILWSVATYGSTNANQPITVTNQDSGQVSTETSESQSQRDYQLCISVPISRSIALSLIDLVTPDVMYNAIPWPDEEFMKITIERDLLIKKKFDESPILWDIFAFLSGSQGAMCYCSAIARGLMAVLMYHWDSCRDKSVKNSPWHFDATCRLIEYMRKGQFIPPPLSYSAELLPYLSPYEVYLILLNIWRYMKENPPVPEERNWKEKGLDAKFLDPLRPIFHSNISKLGHLYGRFFGQ